MADPLIIDPWVAPVFPTGAAFGTGSPAETTQQPSGLYDLLGGFYNSLGGLAQRAIGNSQTAVETGNYNPAPVVEAAMLPMGTGAVAGVPVRGAETVLGAGPIRAYHGSPSSFERFDLSKVGTGEGQQAYGHGLYFAENPQVAESYANTLGANGGHKYEVNIKADPERFVDWDKARMADQPEAVRKVFTDMLGYEPNFLGAGMKIAQSRGVSSAEISRRLNEAGIPGIKYLDEGSRAGAEGSRNYVVFNDSLIDIMRKYGWASLMGAPVLGQALGEQKT